MAFLQSGIPTDGAGQLMEVAHGRRNGTGGDADLRVHERVTEQAEVSPDAVALSDGLVTFTYRELEERSNRLAHRLRAIGVGPDVLVAVCVERSPWMAVAGLAVLKAGGAYVAIDPMYPVERIAWILGDAKPAATIATAKQLAQLPATVDAIVIDEESGEVGNESASAPTDLGSLENLAYVIYTSGSTGKPKGVQITHQSLLNLIVWHQQAFQVTAADRASQVASPGFDAAVWEVWPYLAAGASVHFPDDSTRAQANLLRDWLVQERVSLAFVPTPLAERLIFLTWPVATELRVLLTGADTLHHYPPDNLPFLLVNNYGPTECTVVATSGPVCSDKRSHGLPSIGRPIADTEVYILDESRKPVPAGTVGELYVGGAGVARGYLNQPRLTEERFVPNPFNQADGGRMYRTGDLASFLPDGRIAFLGRLDDQVKIRGYRIELNEIARRLNEHPAIDESLITTREDEGGDKNLVAYVVADKATLPSADELRDFVSRELPEYMVPAIFVAVDGLPVGTNGKIDRGALPEPSEENMIRAGNFAPPQSPTEERVAEILSRLLGVERVGVNDNFFLLGGNSLLGTQVIAQVRDTFDVELTLLTLFDHPTVAGIAREVEQLILTKLDGMSEEEVQRLMAQIDESIEQ